MSHLHERTEKVCLNCGAELTGRYCHKCGQENLEPEETIGHLAMHFFEDLTHFDGKFFTSLKDLFLKPGFLTEEYVKGRRASYLNPVRMYLFISALFFLAAFSIPSSPSSKKGNEKSKEILINNHSVQLKDTTYNLSTLTADTSRLFPTYSSMESYNASQNALPEAKRDNFFGRYLHKRMIAVNAYRQKHPESYKEKVKENIQHAIPKIFFVSLPFFALFLQLLYFRRRKTYYYVSHFIFALHFYCAIFILLLCSFIFLTLMSLSVFMGLIALAFIVYLFVYEYKAMRRFYKQGWFKTAIKFIVLNIAFIIFFISLTILILLNSAMSIIA